MLAGLQEVRHTISFVEHLTLGVLTIIMDPPILAFIFSGCAFVSSIPSMSVTVVHIQRKMDFSRDFQEHNFDNIFISHEKLLLNRK